MTCDELKRDLALAASGVLEETRILQVREHCDRCGKCAARLREYEAVCVLHKNAAQELEALPLQPGTSIVANREPRMLLQPLWRWLVPTVGLGAVTALALLLLRPAATKEGTSSPQTSIASRPSSRQVMAAATLGNYRNALVQHGAASLDAMLERDADRLLSPPSPKELASLIQE